MIGSAIAIQAQSHISICVLSQADSHLYSLSNHIIQDASTAKINLRIISDCSRKLAIKSSIIIVIYSKSVLQDCMNSVKKPQLELFYIFILSEIEIFLAFVMDSIFFFRVKRFVSG